MEDATPDDRETRRSFLSELPGLLLAALVVAVLIKTFVIQPFYIPSGSMIPTLEVNDRVLVSKLSYRFSEPQPGDIVVFESPYGDDVQASIPEAVVRAVLESLGIRASGDEDLIKRVVAVEGQRIEIDGGELIVDGRVLDEPYIANGSRMPDEPEQLVPQDHVFVMGDNRNSSSDSRVFGPIPEDEIIGKAVLRIWPIDRIGGL